MKNLLILFTFFLGLGLTNAQESKPTKQETIQFIIDNFQKDQPIYYEKVKDQDNGSLRFIFTKVLIENISFKGCDLQIDVSEMRNNSYERKDWNKYEYFYFFTYKVIIPLNKIESVNATDKAIAFNSINATQIISVETDSYIKNKLSNEISDKESKKESLSTWNLPFNIKESTKLTKAFNHLRKLCGAPEPISFD
ncbi:hypothetical protein I6I99_09930 [Sphingobacterium multivorum]|nr:hypothetical protein [Sphingobacterium multivorum]QQT32852.1 hypothetical protein I6I99_09930 [Sphingobacterium multivorum]